MSSSCWHWRSYKRVHVLNLPSLWHSTKSHRRGKVHLQLPESTGWCCDEKTDSDSFCGTPNDRFYWSGLREGWDLVWLFLTGLFSGWFCPKEELWAMDQTLNGTIHPACLQEPPLAMDVINRKWLRSCSLIMSPYQWQQQFTHSSSWVSGMFGLISFENRTKYS